jgi:hypothetical protein
MVLLRIGQHAVQRAGDDGLVAHGWSVSRLLSLRSDEQNTENGRDVTNTVIASAAKRSSTTKQDWIASSLRSSQ